MRAGLPVVATALAGVPESVEDGVTGFTVLRGSPAAVRRPLAELIRDSALRDRMGEAGRSRYTERFTYGRMLDENATLLREVPRYQSSSVGRAMSASLVTDWYRGELGQRLRGGVRHGPNIHLDQSE